DKETGNMVISSVTTVSRDYQVTEMKSSEKWSLLNEGRQLSMLQESTGFRGEEIVVTLVYDKK
ncbi:hypothetical protein ACFLQX_01905, partial [Bacteroidota bacterium]